MDDLDTLRDLVERAAGRLAIATVVAALWGLVVWPTGLAPYLDLTPWPWAIAAPFVAVGVALYGYHGRVRAMEEERRILQFRAAVRAAGREAGQPELAGSVEAGLVTRAGGAAPVAPDGPWKEEIDRAVDPFHASVHALASRAPQGGSRLWAAYDTLEVSQTHPWSAVAAVATLWLFTLPLGLTLSLGPWVALVVPAVGVAVLAPIVEVDRLKNLRLR